MADDPKVIPLRLVRDGAPEPPECDVRNVDDWHVRFGEPVRCRHLAVFVDVKERKVTCQACGVETDALQALLDIGSWIREQESRYRAIQDASRRSRCDTESHLSRVRAEKRGLIVGRCFVHGARSGGIPAEAIQEGDYLSRNSRYRVRHVAGQWEVVFWDHAHGLKEIATLRRDTLSRARTAVRDHWRQWSMTHAANEGKL